MPFGDVLAQETPIPNLLLAGAWTRPGHGQIAVLTSGSQAAEKIIELAGAKPEAQTSAAEEDG